MSEFKRGLYRIEGLIEVVVFYSSHDIGWFAVGSNSNVVREHWSSFSNRKPEYLGPAVIGATGKDMLANTPPVGYSNEDGIECWRFDTVTVMRRDGKEAVARLCGCLWSCWCDKWSDARDRVTAEAWCREQLKPPEPKWRPARTDGSDNGKECRVRRNDYCDWLPQSLLAYDVRLTNGPWATINDSGSIGAWPQCEVQE